MSPHREVFDEPIVRVSIDKIKFPKICPVCTKNATRTTRITAAPSKKRWLRPMWDPGFSPSTRRRYGIFPPQTKIFIVPVCDDHLYSGDVTSQYRALCLVIDGITLGIMFLGIFFLGNYLWLGGGLHPAGLPMLFFFPFALFATLFAFRSTPIESSIRIIGFDAALQNVLLHFKNSHYRDMFLQENPMNSELVKWIERA